MARTKQTSQQLTKVTPRKHLATKTARKYAPVSGGVKKRKYRHRPGVVALRQIRKLQRSTDLLLRKAPFHRLVRELVQNMKKDFRFKPAAMEALQVATEDQMVRLFEAAQVTAIHARRITVMPKDFGCVKTLLSERYRNLFPATIYSDKVGRR